MQVSYLALWCYKFPFIPCCIFQYHCSPYQFTCQSPLIVTLFLQGTVDSCFILQGTVESIAMKTPKERTAMFEKISRYIPIIIEVKKNKAVVFHQIQMQIWLISISTYYHVDDILQSQKISRPYHRESQKFWEGRVETKMNTGKSVDQMTSIRHAHTGISKQCLR